MTVIDNISHTNPSQHHHPPLLFQPPNTLLRPPSTPASQNAKLPLFPLHASKAHNLCELFLALPLCFRLASGPPCHDTLGGIALSLRSVTIIAYIHLRASIVFGRSRGPLFLHNYIACLLDQFLYLFHFEIAAALLLFFVDFGEGWSRCVT
jgi:hypothetical protein